MLQTNWTFLKYVIQNKHSMTPEQLKKKPLKQIIKIAHEELDTEEGESNKDEEESTTSTEMLEENTASDTPTEDIEESKSSETHQLPNILNESTHDEDDTSQDKLVTEIELPTQENGEQDI